MDKRSNSYINYDIVSLLELLTSSKKKRSSLICHPFPNVYVEFAVRSVTDIPLFSGVNQVGTRLPLPLKSKRLPQLIFDTVSQKANTLPATEGCLLFSNSYTDYFGPPNAAFSVSNTFAKRFKFPMARIFVQPIFGQVFEVLVGNPQPFVAKYLGLPVK